MPNDSDIPAPSPSDESFFESGWSYRGYLPHFDSAGVIQSVTFRLGDSLPKDVLTRLYAEFEDDAERRKSIEAFIDAGYGSCLLRRPELAEIVEDRLLHDDGKAYRLHAWCIMPNHVHALIQTDVGQPLGDIVHAWKSVSARRIGQHGVVAKGLWQKDYWDRFIRDEHHWHACIEYIHNNPVKAGLAKCPEDWRWGDARRRKEFPDTGRQGG